jgi:methylated-DNA-protein-cysteine methyltransferase related protein
MPTQEVFPVFMPNIYAEIYKIVQSIPKGRVLTYGLISNMIGGRMSAQGVGWALKALGSTKRNGKTLKKTAAKVSKPSAKILTLSSSKTGPQSLIPYNSETVPWQRVVNAEGGTSTHKIPEIPPGLQQHLLELEGVIFDEQGKIDLNKYLWMEGVSNY